MGIAIKVILFSSVVLISQEAISQINSGKRVLQNIDVFTSFEKKPSKRSFLPGLHADKQATYKSSSTYRMVASNSNIFVGDPYWVGSVTQQSYNRGKIGRFYYWDLQGNLRDSFLFVDIAGKNKRGLKLVFPRNKSLF